jgi:hypothetical protein
MTKLNHRVMDKQIRRLKIFSYIKQFMSDEGQAPTIMEISKSLSMHPTTVGVHYAALIGAAGLKLDLPTYQERVAARIDRGEYNNNDFINTQPTDTFMK